MTWTKLGDEFLPAAAELTDGEYRTHVEALIWSSWRMLDLQISKGDVKRFAESPDVEAAIKGLVAKDWWEDRGDAWYVGLRWPEWQQSREQVTNRKAYLTEAKRRSRAHRKGDHSLCLPGCGGSTVASTVDPGRDGNAFAPPPGGAKAPFSGSTVDRTVDRSRGKRTATKAPPSRPPWCGECSEQYRRLEGPNGEDLGRCQKCHPEPDES